MVTCPDLDLSLMVEHCKLSSRQPRSNFPFLVREGYRPLLQREFSFIKFVNKCGSSSLQEPMVVFILACHRSFYVPPRPRFRLFSWHAGIIFLSHLVEELTACRLFTKFLLASTTAHVDSLDAGGLNTSSGLTWRRKSVLVLNDWGRSPRCTYDKSFEARGAVSMHDCKPRSWTSQTLQSGACIAVSTFTRAYQWHSSVSFSNHERLFQD